MRPDADLTVSQWADRHRMLSGRASAEPGRYRTARTPYMGEIMDRLSPGDATQRIVFMNAAQVGAPLALDTPVPTPFGWTTMGGIVERDLLYDERGRICQVTGLSPVLNDRPCFEVEFDDGERIVADGDHRWPVLDFTNDRPAARTLTTAEMIGRVTIGAKGKRRRYAIDCCDAIDMPDQDLILHPYVLGLWLGDGSSIMNHISAHEEDAEIVGHLRACGVEAEFRLPRWRKGRIANVVVDPTFRMRRADGASLSDCFRSRFVTRLRMLDVLDNKHVPLAYMRASRAQRLDLVRGLMDSDGTITPDGKRCEFSNADRGLIDAMVELLRGLGYKPAVYHGRARRKVFGPDGKPCMSAEYWRVSWTAYAEEPMFRLSRKRGRMRSIGNGRPWKSRRRRIVSITPVPSVPVRCIEVRFARPPVPVRQGLGSNPQYRGRKQLDRVRDPPGAGPDARGPAHRGTGQAQLAPADRPADRREPGTAGADQTGAIPRRGQHDAVEGIRRRHPDHDRGEFGGWAALDPGAVHLPRRGRRLSGLGRRPPP